MRFYPTRISESLSRNENRCETDTAFITGTPVRNRPTTETFFFSLRFIIITTCSRRNYENNNTTITFAASMPTDEILTIGDSFNALRTLENPHTQNTIFQRIQEKISSTDKNIEFLRVPSRTTGIYGNEQADKAAIEAATSATSVTIPKITQQDAVTKANYLTKTH